MVGPPDRPARRPGEWITHSTLREVHSSWWMTLRIDDVERPDGSHTEHEVVRGPDPGESPEEAARPRPHPANVSSGV